MRHSPFINEVDLKSACRMVWEAQPANYLSHKRTYGWLAHGCMVIADCCYDYRPVKYIDNLYSPDAFRLMQKRLANFEVQTKGAA